MSFKRGLSAVMAGFGAWAVLKGTAGAQETPEQGQPRVIKVTTPKSSSSSPQRAFLGGLLDSIFDGNSGQPIFSAGPVAATPGQLNTGSNAASTGQRLLNDLMQDFGLTRTQAAGFVGNLEHESAGFETLQEINPTVAGSRGGYGYAQWTGPRRREFEAWAAQNNLNPASYDANYGFLKHELTNTWEKRVIPKLQNANSVESATKIVQDVYLRPGIPHFNSRLNAAKSYA